jgi:hypothetical protein
MAMTASERLGLALLACGTLSSCTGTTSSDGGGDCVSHYDPVASASTWDGLKGAMLGYKERGRVVSVRTQARGDDVGAGDQDAVRVVDLLHRSGRRLVQVDVWRTDAGGWRLEAVHRLTATVGMWRRSAEPLAPQQGRKRTHTPFMRGRGRRRTPCRTRRHLPV